MEISLIAMEAGKAAEVTENLPNPGTNGFTLVDELEPK